MAITLYLFRQGAVGFIDWLDCIAPITCEEEKKNKKERSDWADNDEKNRPHIGVYLERRDCRTYDIRHYWNWKQREPAPSATQSYRNEDLGKNIDGKR